MAFEAAADSRPRIKQVEFAGAIGLPGQPPPDRLPQVAVAGRSNCGKSSLINAVVGRKRLARVSQTPGKTREINFYLLNRTFFLVDLPGFGYARAPGDVREGWKRLVEWYLSRQGNGLRGVVHLVDGRPPPTKLDLEMMEYLADLGHPTLVILTKMDRVPKGKRARAVETAAEKMGLDQEQILPFSAKTGEGREVLLEAVEELLSLELAP